MHLYLIRIDPFSSVIYSFGDTEEDAIDAVSALLGYGLRYTVIREVSLEEFK